MEIAVYIVLALIIVLIGNIICRAAYISERRRVLHGAGASCSRTKECLLAFCIGSLLFGVAAPLYLIGVLWARSIAHREAVEEISGYKSSYKHPEMKSSLQRTTSYENLFPHEIHSPRVNPQPLIVSEPTPLSSNQTHSPSISSVSSSENIEISPLSIASNQKIFSKNEKIYQEIEEPSHLSVEVI